MSATPRRRDAAASRERLLTAGGELFADRGFDRTTARDIGQRANVDPAMIARYFGSKAGLYIAVLHAEMGTEVPADLLSPGRLSDLLERVDRRGAGPIFRAAIEPYEDPSAQAASREELQRRIITPLRDRLAADGDPDPALQAEIITAAVGGIILARRNGTLTSLKHADVADVVAALQSLIAADGAA